MNEPSPVISLREITPQNFNQVIKLQVGEEQKGFVASNVYSLAEAYAHKDACPRAIYADETLVGFLMYGWWAERKEYWVIRLMIDAGQQGRGYGRAAMRILLDQMRAIPGCRQIFISYEPHNEVARKLYASLDFQITGEMVEGEEVARLDLA